MFALDFSLHLKVELLCSDIIHGIMKTTIKIYIIWRSEKQLCTFQWPSHRRTLHYYFHFVLFYTSTSLGANYFLSLMSYFYFLGAVDIVVLQ